MFFPPKFLEDVKTKVSLSSVIGKKVKLIRKNGNQYLGLCPFHKEKTPSFTVNDDKGFYHCFGCGAHGDALSYLTESEKLSFPEAVQMLAEMAGMPLPKQDPKEAKRAEQAHSLYEIMEKTCQFFEKMLYSPAGSQALDYLHGRGLTDENIKHFRLGYAPSGGVLRSYLLQNGFKEPDLIEVGLVGKSQQADRPNFDYFRNRVMFSITDKKGHIIAFGGRVMEKAEPKYLNSPETVLFHKSENLYALSLAQETMRKTSTALLVEGYMDVIALHKIGLTQAVAPLGTALTEQQIDLLWKYAPEPIICFDGDGAGMHAAERAAHRVLPILKEGHSLRFVFLPDNLDPDDFAKMHGRKAFEALLKEAKPLKWLLWSELTVGKKFETPEHFAALEKQIAELLENIKNTTVRGYYEKEFKLELKKFTKEMMYLNQNGKTKRNLPSMTVNIVPTLSPWLNDIKMLLTYIVLFPNLYAEHMDVLSNLKITDKKALRLMEILTTELTENSAVSAEELRAILETKYSKNIFIYLKTELETLERAQKTPRMAEREFKERLDALNCALLQEQIDLLLKEFKQTQDPQTWAQIVSLKQELESQQDPMLGANV